MEFVIDFVTPDDNHENWVGDAPSVEVAKDMVYAANPGAEITWIMSEEDFDDTVIDDDDSYYEFDDDSDLDDFDGDRWTLNDED
jgi:hypothetical protein